MIPVLAIILFFGGIAAGVSELGGLSIFCGLALLGIILDKGLTDLGNAITRKKFK